MANFIKKLVENDKKEIKHLSKVADKVLAFEDEMAQLSDEDFPVRTEEFKSRFENGETLDK